MGASVALLAEEIHAEESGWLTCWKLLQESPKTKVIVLSASHAERGSNREKNHRRDSLSSGIGASGQHLSDAARRRRKRNLIRFAASGVAT